MIRNCVILQLIDDTQKLPIKKDKAVCIYPGVLSERRGTKEIIQAIGFLKGKVELWLIGDWESEIFRKECEGLKGWLYVKYTGHVKLEEVYKYMKASNIGIINYHPSGIEAIPNKPFEYMACSLPMIMSNRSNWRELFNDCALFVTPKNPIDIAEKIKLLIENNVLLKFLGHAGRKLVENKFSWESEGEKLVEFYKKLLNQVS